MVAEMEKTAPTSTDAPSQHGVSSVDGPRMLSLPTQSMKRTIRPPPLPITDSNTRSSPLLASQQNSHEEGQAERFAPQLAFSSAFSTLMHKQSGQTAGLGINLSSQASTSLAFPVSIERASFQRPPVGAEQDDEHVPPYDWVTVPETPITPTTVVASSGSAVASGLTTAATADADDEDWEMDVFTGFSDARARSSSSNGGVAADAGSSGNDNEALRKGSIRARAVLGLKVSHAPSRLPTIATAEHTPDPFASLEDSFTELSERNLAPPTVTNDASSQAWKDPFRAGYAPISDSPVADADAEDDDQLDPGEIPPTLPQLAVGLPGVLSTRSLRKEKSVASLRRVTEYASAASVSVVTGSKALRLLTRRTPAAVAASQ